MSQRDTSSPWLFSRNLDLAAFTAPAIVGLLLIAIFPQWITTTPPWLWIVAILLVDVAHVWSTIFITYFDRHELRLHPARYILIPLISWLLGSGAYHVGGATLFWTGLAYLAVFHFVRQQAGWVALYRIRLREGSAGRLIDLAAVYAATIYPLIWWHTHLPRHYVWFLPGDFLTGLPQYIDRNGFPLYLGCLALYAGRALLNAHRGLPIAWGKHLLVSTTVATWYVGIVATNSETAFTVTNVFTHGLPYGLLVFHYARSRTSRRTGVAATLLQGPWYVAALKFVVCLWVFSYLEEYCWDAWVWLEGKPIFGNAPRRAELLAKAPGYSFSGASETTFEQWLVPLLAVPQLTHYLLDGIFWKKRHNPELKHWLSNLP